MEIVCYIYIAILLFTGTDKGKSKGKAIPLQAWRGPEGSRRLRFSYFKTIGTGCQPYATLPQGNIPGTHFCYWLCRPQGPSAAGRIMPMKSFNDAVGNRTRDLPTCKAVLIVKWGKI